MEIDVRHIAKLSYLKIEDNEIETLYQIDFAPETANGEFRFRVERHD